MVTNAVVHLRTYPKRVRNYSEKVTKSANQLKSRTELYALAREGPSNLYKRPSSLSFIADGGDAYLPKNISNGESWSTSGQGGEVKKQLVVELRHREPGCDRSSSLCNKDRLGVYYHLPALLYSASFSRLMHSLGSENKGLCDCVLQIRFRVPSC